MHWAIRSGKAEVVQRVIAMNSCNDPNVLEFRYHCGALLYTVLSYPIKWRLSCF